MFTGFQKYLKVFKGYICMKDDLQLGKGLAAW